MKKEKRGGHIESSKKASSMLKSHSSEAALHQPAPALTANLATAIRGVVWQGFEL